MNKFCGKCGASVPEHAGFCGSCGASAQQAASPSAKPAVQPVPQPTASPAAATAAKASSPWVKVAIVAVVIIFVGGAVAVGGVIYLAHRVSQKAQEYKREVLGESPTPATGAASGAGGVQPKAATGEEESPAVTGDECHLLSKEDVSAAIGVTILETMPTDGGCSYLAKGTQADMTGKHTAAMVGADKKTQGMLEQFAGAIGSSMPKKEASEDDRPDGNTIVLGFGIDTNDAEGQMKLNAKALGFGGMGNVDAIDGIGDEAFSKADSMMFVRKGDKLIRIMYMTCPCSTNAIKPLAKKIVANL